MVLTDMNRKVIRMVTNVRTVIMTTIRLMDVYSDYYQYSYNGPYGADYCYYCCYGHEYAYWPYVCHWYYDLILTNFISMASRTINDVVVVFMITITTISVFVSWLLLVVLFCVFLFLLVIVILGIITTIITALIAITTRTIFTMNMSMLICFMTIRIISTRILLMYISMVTYVVIVVCDPYHYV